MKGVRLIEISRIYSVHVNRVVAIIISDMEIAISVLPLGSLFAAKGGLPEVNYRPDGLRHNNVAIAINELHVSSDASI